MSPADGDGQRLSPAEEALMMRLQEVRAMPVSGPDAARVVRTARWQRAVRAPLVFAGLLASAAGDGVRSLTGLRRGPGA